ncbi:putative secreted protein [Wickerhamomyces ciferrii]|uniref:Increased recombination centers protein 22 n=1 Tax=Wickerhamomyces ciferrii (strain ATCC 14091 / BCRC 22168 / CBS 111 / JCM 3599 / NBRC 0793 / NRRL Y-1031 F-60-10) TaxID=1206466 RepID=K0KDD6_WICCF|nr:uncharacterized protein BN7_455 [Wickerhamomyces ciferrii]CCH40921.1 putative secreted protein [Wickerhamomyces ciferrii]
MKFFSSLLAFSLVGLVSAQALSEEEQLAKVAAADILHPDEREGHYVDPNEQTPFLFDIDYNIVNKPNAAVLEFYNGEEIVLNYTFTNHEDSEVTLVGLGGQFTNPANGQTVANITDAKLGPLIVPSGESQVFTQRLGINLPETNYLLVPGIYIVKDNSLALLSARSQLAIVTEASISIFNPQLLFLEFLLLATLSVGAYYVYINYGASYFNTASKTATTPQVAGKSGERPKIVTTDSGRKVVDESWLPEHHVKKVNKKNKKAN